MMDAKTLAGLLKTALGDLVVDAPVFLADTTTPYGGSGATASLCIAGVDLTLRSSGNEQLPTLPRRCHVIVIVLPADKEAS